MARYELESFWERHGVGTDPADDVVVFEEKDDTYYLGLNKTKSRRFILITCEHTLRSEVHYLDAHNPERAPQVILPRNGNHEYDVDHNGDWWWILSNDEARDFRLMRAPTESPQQEHWEQVIAHREGHLLLGAELFDRHVVLMKRYEALRHMNSRPRAASDLSHSAKRASDISPASISPRRISSAPSDV